LIVLDNSVLSAFTRLEHLHLIKELFNDVTIPRRVHEEHAKGWGDGALPDWVSVENLSALADSREEGRKRKG
jgi:predicted nucleic acid-binding protein